MRNVYINQIMKPEIQNNLNYAYFENSGEMPDFTENSNIQLNPSNIFFNNQPLKNFSQNFFLTIPKLINIRKQQFLKKKLKMEDITKIISWKSMMEIFL